MDFFFFLVHIVTPLLYDSPATLNSTEFKLELLVNAKSTAVRK